MENTKRKIREYLSEQEVSSIEAKYPDGISCKELVAEFLKYHVKFSEATVRKYVQLGLLPRSRRVGTKGKHKGSHGLYPIGIIRQTNEVKRMMALDYTIEEILRHFAFIDGEIEELRNLLMRIFEKLEESVPKTASSSLITAGLKRQISKARVNAEMLISELGDIATRIREVVQTSREAI